MTEPKRTKSKKFSKEQKELIFTYWTKGKPDGTKYTGSEIAAILETYPQRVHCVISRMRGYARVPRRPGGKPSHKSHEAP